MFVCCFYVLLDALCCLSFIVLYYTIVHICCLSVFVCCATWHGDMRHAAHDAAYHVQCARRTMCTVYHSTSVCVCVSCVYYHICMYIYIYIHTHMYVNWHIRLKQ